MRDRERQHRPERVHVAQKRRLAGDDRQAGDPSEQDDPDPRRAELGVQPAQALGHLAVQPHRVDEPRDADDPGVGGDEEDRGRQQADVDLTGVLQRAEVQVLDDPEDRIAGEPALALVHAEQRLVVTVDLDHRQRRQGDGGQCGVDREHGDDDPVDRLGDRLGLVLGLLGHVGDRLDPRVGDHPHRDRDQEVLPRRRGPQMDVVDERVAGEDEHAPDHDEQQLRGEVSDRQEDVERRGLGDADDVDGAERDHHPDAEDDVSRASA